jgi:hypothetical protein
LSLNAEEEEIDIDASFNDEVEASTVVFGAIANSLVQQLGYPKEIIVHLIP